ncbi:MAG: hypothetical protein WC470_03595 [Candidatus Paceibacterota bacterium]
MSFFSKKLTANELGEGLTHIFDFSYASLVSSFKGSFENQQITEEQDKELLVVPMLAITNAVIMTFKDSPVTEKVLERFQQDIQKSYFNENEAEEFIELFWQRFEECSKIPQDKNITIQFGQIFCNHFLTKNDDANEIPLGFLAGSTFMNVMIEAKKFLNEISSQYKII